MKNHLFAKRAIYRVLLILLTTAIFTSCSKDEDEGPSDPGPQNVSFRIELQKISASGITESDESLEVYGTINSKLRRDNITEENMIFSRSETNWINVGTSDVPLTESFTYVVAVANVEASELEIIGSLTDRDPDGNPHEFLGTRSLSIPLPNITDSEEYVLVFDDDSPNTVRLTYSITRL